MNLNENCASFFAIIDTFNKNSVLEEGKNSKLHNLLKELYGALRHYSSLSLHLEEQYKEIIILFIELNLKIIINSELQAETSFLSSTCLLVVLQKVGSPKFCSDFIVSAFFIITDACTLSEEKEKEQYISKMLENFNSWDKVTFNQDLSPYAQGCKLWFLDALCEKDSQSSLFPRLYLLHGIVHGAPNFKPNLFLCKMSHYNNIHFLISMFDPIHLCCITPCSAQYHAFSILFNWLKLCQNLLPDLHSSSETQPYFSPTSKIIKNSLHILEANWESPIQGVTGFIKEIYKILIKISDEESKLINSASIVAFLLEKTMKLSWNVKGKYLVLSSIIPHLNYKKFLEDYPDAPTIIISNLKVNYSSSITGEVYKSIVLSMKKNSTSEELIVKWNNYWLDPIVKSFYTADKLLIQNIKNVILPWTIKTIPESYVQFLKAVQESKENKNVFELVLLRIAKECNICSLEHQEIDVIKKYLHHGDVSVRMEVFSVMCSSSKKSEKVSTEILQLIKEFIGFNLNAESVAFQQRLLAQIRLLLIRIRDSSVQEYRLNAKHGQMNLDLSQLEYVDWLVHTSIENTFPGACYQRRRLCLEMLNVVFDVFLITPLGMKKKEKPSDSVKCLIKWAQDHQLLLCFRDNSLLNILPCITDFTDEIRMLTANLIQNHCKILNDESLIEFAFSLCNNPDVRNSDSGAFVCQIIFKNMCLKENDFSLLQDNPEFNGHNSTDGMNFLNQIYNMAKSQLYYAKNNLLESSFSQPLHGSLLALHHCICNFSSFFSDMYMKQPDATLGFVQNIIQLCDDTIKYMLFAMSGKNQSNASASFAEIGEALRDLAICKHHEISTENSENKTTDKIFCDDLTSMSAECELLLSCCWHSIKNSCYLITELSVPISNMNFGVKQLLLSQVASILSSTLISCRHRGVVDSCSSSLSKFCKHIASDKSTYEKITMKMVEEAIKAFTEESSVSVTRRSAGLPLLFQAVVSSEQNNVNRKLLPFCLNKLLGIMCLPLPSNISEKIDLPHVHAYHIVKALVTDSSLSQNILLWSNLLITTCVQGFSSPCWAIRNGALQVFGVLLPRLCGQKKVRNDDSEHNSVTSSELFLRFPNLQNYLLQQLQSSVELHCNKKIRPELIPLLLLVVKLMPQEDEHCYEMVDFKPLLEKLLDSPVWKIRSLASTALSKFLNLEHAIALLNALKKTPIRCNWIHGVLLTVRGILRKFKTSFQNSEDMENALIGVIKFMRENVKCNIISALLADIINELNVSSLNSLEVMQQNFSENCSTDSKIGYSLLMSKKTLFELNACSQLEIPVFFNQQSENDQQIQKVCLEYLSSKLLGLKSTSQCYSNENLKFWKDVFLFLVKYIDTEKHQSIVYHSLKFMIELCSDYKIGDYVLDLNTINLLDCHLQEHLDMKSGLSVAALSFTMWSLCERVLLSIQSQSCSIEKWNFKFNTYCRPQSSEMLRMQAAESLVIFGPPLVEYLKLQLVKQPLSAAIKLICLCEGSLLLLQDEDEEVRNKASMFPSNIPNEYKIEFVQFNVGIKVVCQLMTDMLMSNSVYILYLWNRLQCMPSAAKVLLSCSQKKKANLFEQEYVNVYAEPIQLLLLYKEQFITAMTHLSKSDYKKWNAIITMIIYDTMFELEDVKSTLDYIGMGNIAIDFTWNHQVYMCLKMLELQISVIQAQELLPQMPKLKDLLQKLIQNWESVQSVLTQISLF